MIHGEHTIKTAVMSSAKESVGSVWAEALYFVFINRLLYGGDYDVVLFVAEHSVLSAMRVQGQDCDARATDIKVSFQRCVKLLKFLADSFDSEGWRYLRQGQVCGC